MAGLAESPGRFTAASAVRLCPPAIRGTGPSGVGGGTGPRDDDPHRASADSRRHTLAIWKRRSLVNTATMRPLSANQPVETAPDVQAAPAAKPRIRVGRLEAGFGVQ